MRYRLLALLLAALFVALPTGAVDLEWVYVGDPGNAPDTATNCYAAPADCGSVPYGYYISKYEVTNAQYAEFLNAKAAADPLGLYNESMDSDATFGGITRGGRAGDELDKRRARVGRHRFSCRPRARPGAPRADRRARAGGGAAEAARLAASSRADLRRAPHRSANRLAPPG